MIALDFTNTYIHAVEGKALGDKLIIERYASAPMKTHITTDGKGDREKTAETLRGLLSSGGFRGKDVTVLFSRSNVISNEYELPYEKNPAAMGSMVRGEVAQATSLDDYVMDYTILDTFPKDGAAFCRAQAYLARRALVEFAFDVITKAGRKPCIYTVAQNCLNQLQHFRNGFCSGDMIAASVGSSRVFVTLLAQPNICVTRLETVMPGAQAYESISSHTYDPSTAADITAEQISKMMQYYSIKYPGGSISSVYLFGDIVSEEMAEHISAALGAGVSLLPQPAAISAADGFSFQKYAYAAGALLEK